MKEKKLFIASLYELVSKRLLLSTIICLTLSTVSYSQILAPLEDYPDKLMDDSVINGERVLISSGGSATILTYDFNGAGHPDSSGDYTSNMDLIPTTAENSTAWTVSDADRSVFQAHYITGLVVSELEALFGISFGEVHVAANVGETDGRAHVAFSNLNRCFISLGNNGGSTYAEYDIIAHKLTHIILSEITGIGGTDPDLIITEGFSDLIGVHIEGNLHPTGIEWVIGNNTPATDVRDLTQFLCWNNDKTTTGHLEGRSLGHWFFLLSTGSFGIDALGREEVILLLLEAIQNGGSEIGREDLRLETLLVAETQYGRCTREYRSIENAWKILLECTVGSSAPPFYPKECCDAGNEVLRTDITIDEAYQFDGNLIVPPFTTLTITSDAPTGREFEEDQVTFPPGTGIIVQFAGTLILDNARLTSCGEGEWAGITIEEGGRLRTDFPQIRNATKGIELQGNVNEANMNTNFIADCAIGMNLVGVTHIDLTDEDGRYDRCNIAIQASSTNGSINNAGTISECRSGIVLQNGSDMKVTNNMMNCSHVGIRVNNSSAEVGHNHINGDDLIVDQNGNIISAVVGLDGIVYDFSNVYPSEQLHIEVL